MNFLYSQLLAAELAPSRLSPPAGVAGSGLAAPTAVISALAPGIPPSPTTVTF